MPPTLKNRPPYGRKSSPRGSLLYPARNRRQAVRSPSGIPLFLKRSAISSGTGELVQRQLEEENENPILEAAETRDAAELEPIEFEVSQLSSPAAKSVEIPRMQPYSAQFRQLEILIGERTRARAVTIWAMNFFQGSPSIEDAAQALSRKVDDALFAINKLEGAITWLDLTSWFGLFRKPIDAAVDLYLKKSFIPWLITYRIPRSVAVALYAVEDVRGKCEEHAFLTIYLLSIGHMIQGMPFGQLRGDIYYTGAATEEHAMAILVKGAEFKDAVKACIAETGGINAQWLCKHTELWGANAWIADGWNGEAKKLSDNPITLSYYMTQGFRRDPRDARKLPSEWDVTVLQMANRVARDYGIQ